jgi:predicted amidophosphoribosyltransferase
MQRCPICRARLRGESLCPRCGTDLSLPVEIEQRAQRLEQEAVRRLAAGQLQGAESRLVEALGLCATPLGRLLLRFVRDHRRSHPRIP